MNEQAQQALANLLSMAVDGIGGAVEFSKAQLPEVVEQLLMWRMTESAIWFSVGIMVMTITVWANLKAHGAIKKGDMDDMAYAIVVPVSLFTFTGGFAATAASLDWLKIMIAPKLYLLEYAASLVK
jgi:hypothetical protein